MGGRRKADSLIKRIRPQLIPFATMHPPNQRSPEPPAYSLHVFTNRVRRIAAMHAAIAKRRPRIANNEQPLERSVSKLNTVPSRPIGRTLFLPAAFGAVREKAV